MEKSGFRGCIFARGPAQIAAFMKRVGRKFEAGIVDLRRELLGLTASTFLIYGKNIFEFQKFLDNFSNTYAENIFKLFENLRREHI